MLGSSALGPIVLEQNGQRVALGGRLARRLVAVLASRPSGPVPDEVIVQGLWGDAAPAQAVVSLQAYVSRLRAALGEDRDRLERTDSGYRLRVDESDVQQFENAVGVAVRALKVDPSEAARAARAAIALWRGEPFPELGDAEAVLSERGRLTELQALAVETLLDARLALGESSAVVSAAREAVDAAPFREHRWVILIAALHRAGRQGEALAAVREVKRVLADELGVDPGPELQEIEQRVFSGTPLLMERAGQPASPGPRPVRGLRAPTTAFVGRADDLEHLVRAVGEVGAFVTITGTGGVGKTRLALEWAAAVEQFDVRYVPLGDLHEPQLLAATVAEHMGLASRSSRAVADLGRALAGTGSVLLLDNAEHLIAALGPLVVELRAVAPDLRVVATSREPLGVDGETVLALRPLPPIAADGTDGSGVALLLDRIARARVGWVPDERDLANVRRLCSAVDGIPLALELAAVRSRTVALATIVEHLDGRFTALGAVPVGSVAAHRDLATTIAWSVGLLEPRDRTLLERLWPFEGGFDLELAIAAAPDTAPVEVLESVASLTSKSLLSFDPAAPGTRYRLLETTRGWLQHQAAAPGAVRAAHARAVRALIADAADGLASPRSRSAVERLSRDLANVREALRHDAEAAPAAALHAFASIDWFWFRTGRIAEGLHWADRLLEGALDGAPVDRARARAAIAVLSATAGDLPRAIEATEQAAAELGVLGKEVAYHGHIAYARSALAAVTGRIPDAIQLAQTAAEIGRRHGSTAIEANGVMQAGVLAAATGDLPAAKQAFATAARITLPHDTPWTAGMSALHLARALLRLAPDDDDLRPALRRAARIFQQEADLNSFALTLRIAADVDERSGDAAGADHLRREVARASRDLALPGDAMTRGERVAVEPAEEGGRTNAVQRLLIAAPAWLRAELEK